MTIQSAARASAHLPEIPDAQVKLLRALPRGVVRSPGELAESLGLGRSTVSNLLTARQERGLVLRHAVSGDGRRVEVTATPNAPRLFERFDDSSAALIAAASAELNSDDRAALAAALPVLERLRDALDEQRRDAASRITTHHHARRRR
mgnify:CR=1 FL=1